MGKLIELRRALEDLKLQMRGLLGETLTPEEFKTKSDDLESKRSAIEAQIRLAEQVEKDEQQRANEEGQNRQRRQAESEETKIKKRYSLMRAVQLVSSGKPLDGVEGEMQQEADKEAREGGLAMEGNLRIPSVMIRGRSQAELERRTTLIAGTAGVGGNLVQTELSNDFITFLSPQLKVEALGATMLTGLVGNLDIPRENARSSAVWASEVASSTETNQTFNLLSLRPKRLTAFTPVSKTLMVQGSLDVENLVRTDLNQALQIAIDAAAINGSGSSNQPTGILNLSGIGSVVGGTNGASLIWSHLVDLETAIAAQSADSATMAYLTTPGIRGKAKKTEKFTNTGFELWENGEVNGYRAEVSTQVPSTLTKGTASAICHAIIFGDWSQLIIGMWGGLDITVDPYTRAKEAIVELVVNSWVDIGVRHPESFAAMKDALIS